MKSHIPSKCLYFSKPLREQAEVINESRNTITLPDRILCFRIPSNEELKMIAGCHQKVITVVDDDYWAIVRDRRLPLGYRSRMFYRLLSSEQQLRRLTNQWVVTSPALEKIYPDAARIDPNWNIPSDPICNTDRDGLHIAFLGTRSHLHDLEVTLPSILSFLRDYTTARLSLFLGKHCPDELLSLPNVTNYEPMCWRKYRDFIVGLDIDISLIPSEDTQVNTCRSRNKLFEAVHAGGICLVDANYAHKAYAEKHQLAASYRIGQLNALLENYLRGRKTLTELQIRANTNALKLQKQIIEVQKSILLSS